MREDYEDRLKEALRISEGARRRVVEPGRKSTALEAGPEITEIDIGRLADSNCKYCNGRGIMRMGPVQRGAGVELKNVCVCADKGYKKFMEKRIQMPCRFCGEVGWCNHRPRSLKSLLKQKEDNLRALQQIAKLRPHAIGGKHERGVQGGGQGSEPNLGTASGPAGQATAPDGHPDGRKGKLPGLQPGCDSD